MRQPWASAGGGTPPGFVPARGRRAGSEKNTGLGLFLAREILDITGITIRETGEPGKGARFEMTVHKKGVAYGRRGYMMAGKAGMITGNCPEISKDSWTMKSYRQCSLVCQEPEGCEANVIGQISSHMTW